MPLAGPPLDSPADLLDLVRDTAASRPDDWALGWRGGRYSWSELDEAVERWRSALSGLGLEPGERVASLVPNCAELVVHYLACVRAGLVAVPLNYRYVAPQIDHALQVSGASLLLAHDERIGELVEAGSTERPSRGCVVAGDGAPWGLAGQAELVAGAGAPPPAPDRSDDDPAFLFFTSGSTGPAKGVTHTVGSTGWMLASAAAAFEMTDRDVFLPASSMSHLGAFLWTMSSFSVGAPVVVAATSDGDELRALLQQYRPTLLAMIPAALIALVRDHGATAEDFASLRLCRSGSDHVPEALEDEFLALTDSPIDEGYGMSEVGLATLNPPSGTIKAGSIGTPVPGFELALLGEDGEEVPVGEVGRIHLRTRSATVGYWENPEATRELLHDGWLDSGDLARRDEDGYLWFFGRAKQIIVHDGSNISPQEVEDALSEHPAVSLAGVVGVHDEVHGEDVRAYVSLVDGATPTAAELIGFARDRVGYRAPSEIVVLDALPLNPTGKVDRTALKRLAEDHRNPHRPG